MFSETGTPRSAMEKASKPTMLHKIVIIEDEKIVNSMLTAWLSRLPDFEVLGSAFSGSEGIALCERTRPDMVLLDNKMPDMCGLEVSQKLKEIAPEMRIVILSAHCDPYSVYQISRLNLNGFIDKASPIESLIAGIRQVADGKYYFTQSFNDVKAMQLNRPDAFHKILTPRELAVLILVSGGEDDANIGSRLGISHNTVATHRRNLRTKLKGHSDRDLIAYAQEWGLVPSSPGETQFRWYSPFVPPQPSRSASGA